MMLARNRRRATRRMRIGRGSGRTGRRISRATRRVHSYWPEDVGVVVEKE